VRNFLLHLRNSPARWMLLVLLPADVAVLFLRPRYWIGVWPETGAAAQIVAGLTIPLIAGAAAWAAAASSRHKFTEQLAAAQVGPARVEAQRLGATTAILLLPYLLVHLIAVVLTARTDPPGLVLWAGYFGHGLFLSFFSIAFGWFIGRAYRSMFSTVVAAVGALFVSLLLGQVTSLLLTSGPVALTVATGPLVARLVLAGILLVVLLYLPGRRGLRVAAALGYGTGMLGLIVILVTTPVVMPRPPSTSAVCTTGERMKLCLWPEHDKYRPPLQAMADRVATLPAQFTPPAVVNEEGLDPSFGQRYLHPERIPASEPYSFTVIEGSPWSIAGDLANTVLDATLDFRGSSGCQWDGLTPANRSQVSSLYAWLEGYIVGAVNPDYHTDAPPDMQQAWATGRALLSDTRQRQFAWAQESLKQLRGQYCRAAS